ncbi:Uma2 family endonuclease [Nocardiopsis sp. RSe5-2]|uniref:Uma2 family endonuclease n=1 Tax=Nocardiopsis endophytica TaxID=3018445 RepID=A0ABT4UAV0_9ACTN|nr:Uma2 family endonuclease [Nocardiopsis endophytica]MDA2814097.1 Uma2 family endonuclease [Nocardiopsis endophytica]
MALRPLADQVLEALPKGFKVEVLDGVFIASPRPTLRRTGVRERIFSQLLHQLQPPMIPLQRTAVGLPDSDDYAIPDAVVLDLDLEDTDADDWLATPEEVYFAMDVVPRSDMAGHVLDRAVVYPALGIPLYLIADPGDASLILHSAPTDGVYTSVNRLHFGDTVKLPSPLEGIVIETGDLMTYS